MTDNLPAQWAIVGRGRLGTALTAVLWGGFVRVFLLHHVTWSINSVCHFFGRKRFDINCATCHGPLGAGDSIVARQMSAGTSAAGRPSNEP